MSRFEPGFLVPSGPLREVSRPSPRLRRREAEFAPVVARILGLPAFSLLEANSKTFQLQHSEWNRRLGGRLGELLSLAQERDAGMFYEGLAQLGRRLEGDGREDVAREIYSTILAVRDVPANVRTLAQERLGVLNGGGGFGQQAERFLRRAPEETFHSSMFLGFIPTMMAGKALRLGALSWLSRNPAVKLWTRGWGVEAAAGLMGLVGEAAVLPVATRVGALALGEKLSWEPEQLRQEAWGSLLFLGGMRLVTVGAGLVPARGKALLGAVGSRGAGPLLGGIALGQQFETWAGLRAPTEGSARLFEILSTYGQIWGAGVLAGGLLGHHFVRWERAAEARVEAMKGSASRDIAHIAAQWSSAPEFSGKTKSGKGGDTWSGGPKRLDLPSHFAMNSRDSSTASTLPPPPRARPLGRDEATRDSGITHVEPSSPPLPSGHFRIRRTNPPSGHPDPDLAVRLDDTITALRTSEAYQRALTQAIPDPVFSLRRVPGERDFQFVAIHAPNPAELLFPADQLFQTSLARLPLDPALLEFGLAALEEALQQPGTIVEIEYDAATPSGIISQEARIVAHGSEELVVFVRDITNRKAEEAKRESLLREAAEQRLAQERADALQLVSRGLAHEFNNVLQGMMVQLDFMQHPFAGLLEVAQALMKPDADFGSQLREARAELMGIATRGIASRRHGNPAVAPPPETPEELVREIAKIMGNILGQSVQDLAEARQHTDRFQGMITHFMRQTADPIPVQPFDLHSLLTTAYLKSHFSKPPVFSLEQVELSLDPEAKPIWGHRELAHVVRNLLINAKEALKAQTQPKIEISTRRVTLGPEDISLLLPWSPLANLPTGAFLVLQVRDNGIGMDEATRQRIFDSGFTTKQRTLDHSGNHGLGLPFSLKLMKDIGGMMTVESEPGKGTVFQAFFPEAPLPNP